MGRPSHKPDPLTRRQVEAMAGYGVPEADIAGLIGIDAKTLRKHYRSELDLGHVKANVKVAENLFRKATGEGREAVTAAIFWMKSRAGWREVALHEVSGRLDHRFVIETPKLPEDAEEWEERFAPGSLRVIEGGKTSDRD